MKKILSAAALFSSFLCLPLAANAASNDMQEVLKQLEYLKNKVQAQQEHIDALESKMGKEVKVDVGAGGNSKVVLANKFIDQLELKGDLRVRYERRDEEYKNSFDKDDATRDRIRTRFRIGGVWKNSTDNIEIGAGLATGGSDPTSTNDTWSDGSPFETGDIRLDYAYASHKWNDWKFTLGQHKNPYKTSWVLWDGDVRLAGLTAHYGQKKGLFGTIGGYGASYDGDNMAMLYAAQLGWNGKMGDASYTLAAGYHTYDQSFISDDNADNELGNIDDTEYEINVGDLFGKVTMPITNVKLTMYGHFWQNFGADGNAGESQATSYTGKPEDADTGYVVGLDAKINKFKLGYAYSVVEADSLYGFLSDSDFGTGLDDYTNKKGHKIKLGYSFTKNWSAGLTYLNHEHDEDLATMDEDQVELYQFDVKYKF